LILQARSSSDRAVRAPLYREIVRLIMDDVPYIFTFYSLDRFIGRSNVQGWYFGVRATTGYSEYWLSVP
jgi:ABC-type transport system substrate-binding protein